MKRFRAFTLVLVAALCACDANTGPSKTPQDAKGDTPIRYVICRVGGTDCFVAARFKDMDSCESHRHWADMLCDSVSEPGKMVCRENNYGSATSAYCTQ